jgi:ribosome-binding factor A
MRHRNRGARGDRPPFVDPLFAEALSGDREKHDRRSERKHDYKAAMLCRQVQRVLSLSLADVSVVDVTPGPDSSRLLVHVAIPRHIAVDEALARLNERMPSLRAEVARAITRKRAPELVFVPASGMEMRNEE